MTVASLQGMSEALTAPYKRGLETLEVPVLAAAANGEIALGGYDYQSYQDRYSRLPDSPRHLLIARFAPVEPLDVIVAFRRAQGAVLEHVTVELGSSSVAGIAHPIRTGDSSTAALRLVSILPTPDPPSLPPADAWRVVVLLGNLAKLLWVMGAEHEELAANAGDLTLQRLRTAARGPSLDLLGADLGVPRFPPVPYSVDDNTVCLYHLDDVPPSGQPEPAAAFDEVERFRPGSGHPAANAGQAARSRRPGRFTFGFGFRSGAGSLLEAPDHADFAVSATQGLTVEATILPTPRVAAPVPGTIVAKRNVLNVTADPGYGLAIGSFRAIDNNLRFSVSDGTNEVTVFADVDIADGGFHHVAGTVERRGGGAMVRLWLDGQALSERRVALLGALTSAAGLDVGSGREQPGGGGGAQLAEFDGVIDEVRISRVARPSFHPAVGEGDVEYRRRLGIFERWQLPTPGRVVAAINELVQLSRGGQTFAESFVISEDDAEVALATHALEVVPRRLARSACAAADGRQRVAEAEIAGAPDDDPSFAPAWLVRHDDLRVVYPSEGSRLMQRSLAQALDTLLDRLGAGALLRLRAGYDPAAAGDLRSVGRALEFMVDGVEAQVLAGHALLAGFDAVTRTRDDLVRVAQTGREALGVATQPVAGATVPAASDIGIGDDLELRVVPDLPADAEVQWVIIACGQGEADFVDAAGAPIRHATGTRATLHARAAGDLAVRVEATVHGHRGVGTRTLRIGLSSSGSGALPASTAIGGDGRVGVTEGEASGGRASFFHPVYLVCHAAANVEYGGNVLNRRMQRRTADALDRMLAVLGGGTLHVERAYDAAAADLHAEGRALRLSHSSITGAALAAAAFAARFEFIQRLPNNVIHVSVAAGELAALEVSTGAVHVGEAATVTVRPQSEPSAVGFAPDGRHAYIANAGSSTLSEVSIHDGALTDQRALPVDGVALVDLNPGALVVAPDGQHVWTTSATNGTVSAVATQPLALVASFTTGPKPVDVAVKPDGSRLYVACAGDSTLRVHDTANGAQVASVALPAQPVAVVVAPNGAEAWVACGPAAHAVVVDLVTNAVSGPPLALPSIPAAIAVAPGGGTVYVALPGDRNVLPIDRATRIPGAPIDVACSADALAPSPDGLLVWLASEHDGIVRALHTAGNALDPARVLPGARPSGLAARAAAGGSRPAAVLCCTAGDSQLALLDPSALGTPRAPTVLTIQLGAGAGELLHWTTLSADYGEADLSSTVAPVVRAEGALPGRLLVRALYVHPGKTNPYQFELRLRPELDHDDVILRKDQYDIVMNILNTLHPIGVEVRTDDVRAHVIEIREGLADAFPGYTYPNFRTGSLTLPATPTNRS